MPTQTAASRGYVLFRGAIRDTHKSPTNCLPECGHDPWSAPNLERHGSSKMQPFGWLEMPYFLNRIFHLYFHMKSPSVFLIILLIPQKRSMLPPLQSSCSSSRTTSHAGCLPQNPDLQWLAIPYLPLLRSLRWQVMQDYPRHPDPPAIIPIHPASSGCCPDLCGMSLTTPQAMPLFLPLRFPAPVSFP